MSHAHSKVLLPSPEVQLVCDQLDRAISAQIDVRRKLAGYAEFEATAESRKLYAMSIRHIEGVLTLAREDLVLLPAANALARAALETAAKGLWLVDHNDAYVREVRWLAHMREEERLQDRLAKRVTELSVDASSLREREKSIRDFREHVESELPTGLQPLKHNATVDEMLVDLKATRLYLDYIQLSQYVHGSHAATWLYRQGLGTVRADGEYIAANQWHLPLVVCWYCLRDFASRMLWRIGSTNRNYLSKSDIQRTDKALESLRTSAMRRDA